MALIDDIKAGTTDYQASVRVIDAVDGTPETGVAYNTSGVALWYRREGGSVVDITEVTQTVNGAHTDGGFVHEREGYCRLDLPDAAVATGAKFVDIGGTFTGMVVIGGRIRLRDYEATSDIAAAVWAYVIENSKSALALMRLMYAALCNKVSGMGTTNVVFRDDADSKNRIDATVDSSGNRSAVSKDAT